MWKNIMSWTNDTVLEFLELYKREQVLWDPKHPNHRNRTEINEAWQRISASLNMNCSIVDLKRKKESLMTSFRLHLNKKKKAGGEYRTSWFAFSLMESFLGGKYECDSTNQAENETELFNSPNYLLPRNQVGECSNISNVNLSQKISTDNSSNNPEIFYKKSPNEAVVYVKSTAEKRELDECDLYSQLLAKKLKKLNEHQRDIAMHEIDNVMFRVKMQNNSSFPRGYSSSPPPVHRKMKSPIFIVTQPQSNSLNYEDDNIQYSTNDIQVQPES